MVIMNQERLMTILLEPRVTEKSTLIGEAYNQYVFKVAKDATKPEIKQAVEFLFDGSEVISVQVMNVKGKKKMFAKKHFGRTFVLAETFFRPKKILANSLNHLRL